MDLVRLSTVRPPTVDEIRRRIEETPNNELSDVLDLYQELHQAYGDGAVPQMIERFEKRVIHELDRALLKRLWGQDFYDKVRYYPLLKEDDEIAIIDTELLLDRHWQRYGPPKRGFRQAASVDKTLELLRLYDGAREWGYLQIAKELRNYASQAHVRNEIPEEAVDEMTKIIRRVGGHVDGHEWCQMFLQINHVALKHEFTEEDWLQLKLFIPESRAFELVFGQKKPDEIFPFRQEVHAWAGSMVRALRINPSIFIKSDKAKRKYEKVLSIIRRQELTAVEREEVDQIVHGNFRAAYNKMTYTTDVWKTTVYRQFSTVPICDYF